MEGVWGAKRVGNGTCFCCYGGMSMPSIPAMSSLCWDGASSAPPVLGLGAALFLQGQESEGSHRPCDFSFPGEKALR